VPFVPPAFSDRDLSGNSLFCRHCAFLWREPLHSCKKKPTSPRDAAFCVHCGVQSFPMPPCIWSWGGWSGYWHWVSGYLLARGLWGVGFEKWGKHGSCARCCLDAGAQQGAPAPGSGLAHAGLLAAIYLRFVWAGFPGEVGANLRKAYGKMLALGWKVISGFLSRVGALLYKLLVRLVEGRKAS
jgi:hypothetical protein